MSETLKPNTEIAADLLIQAANFFRNIAKDNNPIAEQMEINARIYEQVAQRLIDDPQGSSETN